MHRVCLLGFEPDEWDVYLVDVVAFRLNPTRTGLIANGLIFVRITNCRV